MKAKDVEIGQEIPISKDLIAYVTDVKKISRDEVSIKVSFIRK